MSEAIPVWKIGDYVRIKAVCMFHGMVGEIKYKHGSDYGVFLPWCFASDQFARSAQASFLGDQLWPATRAEFVAAIDAHRLQTPKPTRVDVETTIHQPPKELINKLLDQRSEEIRLGIDKSNGDDQ